MRGDLGQEKGRKGICVEPCSEHRVAYGHMAKLPVDSRGAGLSPAEMATMNRIDDRPEIGDMDPLDYVVRQYTRRCDSIGEEPDPRVIAGLRED